MNSQKRKMEVLKIFKILPKTKKENILIILQEIIRKEEIKDEKKKSTYWTRDNN